MTETIIRTLKCDHCSENLLLGGESRKTYLTVTQGFRPNNYQYSTLQMVELVPDKHYCNWQCLEHRDLRPNPFAKNKES